MCTTSTEYKTITIVVLMVKSGMDPHMISRDFGQSRMVGLLGFPFGAEVSWLNRLVGAGDSMGSCPIGAGDSLWCSAIRAGVS
jgi:hypothetical protein